MVLKKRFPDADIYTARALPGFTEGLGLLDPASRFENWWGYYGVVVVSGGFSVWDQVSHPRKLAEVDWAKFETVSISSQYYRGRKYLVAELKAISSGVVIPLSFSARRFGFGTFSRRSVERFVERLNAILDSAR
jgi:hypothetical protein